MTKPSVVFPCPRHSPLSDPFSGADPEGHPGALRARDGPPAQHSEASGGGAEPGADAGGAAGGRLPGPPTRQDEAGGGDRNLPPTDTWR